MRLLPMSKKEFETYEKVISFLTMELKERGGKYYFRSLSMKYEEDVMVAFQYDGGIIASAVLKEKVIEKNIYNGIEYSGYYIFDTETMKVCNPPITADQIKEVDLEFKGYSQAIQYLKDDCINLIR